MNRANWDRACTAMSFPAPWGIPRPDAGRD